MFTLIAALIIAFCSMIGSILFGIVLIVLLGDMITDFIMVLFLTFLIAALLLAGTYLDCRLRDKYNMSHKKEFSPLWTIVSIIELSILVVLVIITDLGLIPISVLIYDVVIYMILSIIILSRKIRKITNNVF